MNNIPPKIDRSYKECKWIKCPCYNGEYGNCTITHKDCLAYPYNNIPSNCPAREGIFIKWEQDELDKDELDKEKKDNGL